MADNKDLPELPAAAYRRLSDRQSGLDRYYTADQMHAFREAGVSELRAEVERLRGELFKLGRMSEAPCFCCGYNGAGYFQPASHPCADQHHRLFHGDDGAARSAASGESAEGGV